MLTNKCFHVKTGYIGLNSLFQYLVIALYIDGLFSDAVSLEFDNESETTNVCCLIGDIWVSFEQTQLMGIHFMQAS